MISYMVQQQKNQKRKRLWVQDPQALKNGQETEVAKTLGHSQQWVSGHIQKLQSSTDKDIKSLILLQNGKTKLLLLKEVLNGKTQAEVAKDYVWTI